MKLTKLLARCKTKVLLTVAGFSCLAQVFSGCNEDLRNQLLAGVNSSLVSLVTTFINAFFQSLTSQSQTSQPVVRAVLDVLPTLT